MKTHFLLCYLSSVGFAPAAILMFDFGPTTVTGADRTNSPYHSQNPGFTDTSWNKIELTDVTSNILMSDGSSSSVAVNLGSANNAADGSTLVNLSQQPTGNSALGSPLNTGVYEGTSVGTDGIFTGTGSAIRHTGVNITGLAAGVYEVFVATRNTNTTTTNAYTMTAYVGAGAANTNFDFMGSGYTSSALTFTGTGGSTAWVQEGNAEENFHRLTVTITDGQAINVSVSASGSQTRGFLNMIQIVSVPEPSTTIMALGIVLPVLCRRRRVI